MSTTSSTFTLDVNDSGSPLYKGYSTDNYMDKNSPEIRQAKRELLKQGYSKTKRLVEITWMILVALLLPLALYNVFTHATIQNLVPVAMGLFIGILFADFMSGLVHWAADTWGTLEVPFFGPTFIRSFREHHVAPTAMCEHDWIETNGDNFMLVVLPLYFLSTKDFMGNAQNGIPNWFDMFTSSFWITACIGVALTNQFHKWSHTFKPPAIVSLLQDCWIILPKSSHQVHHRPAFDGYYCITTGWLNPVLEHIGFWKSTEKIINRITGLIPREDDWKWTGLVPETPQAVQQFMCNKKNSDLEKKTN